MIKRCKGCGKVLERTSKEAIHDEPDPVGSFPKGATASSCAIQAQIRARETRNELHSINRKPSKSYCLQCAIRQKLFGKKHKESSK